VKRGDLYRVPHPTQRDPRRSRVFVVVSRQVVIDSNFSTVICAPIYSAYHSLASELPVGIDQGLKHESSICCDELVSLQKSALTDYVGALDSKMLANLDHALAVALDLGASHEGS